MPTVIRGIPLPNSYNHIKFAINNQITLTLLLLTIFNNGKNKEYMYICEQLNAIKNKPKLTVVGIFRVKQFKL